MRWTIGASRPQAVEVAGSGSGSHRSEEKKGSDEKSTAHVLFFAERGPPIETVRKFRE
ncbi:hypothetical protein JCM18918_3124 [Cutibacterium acnes JCM 18918]|nr:hypothetical protein JCM18918_3124 [Cutibacterium acnes JCM 18918]